MRTIQGEEMKTKITICIAIGISFAGQLLGCATCVGRLAKSDEPFFADSFYRSKMTSSHGSNTQDALIEDEAEGDENDDVR